jgi:hypothetical protein
MEKFIKWLEVVLLVITACLAVAELVICVKDIIDERNGIDIGDGDDEDDDVEDAAQEEKTCGDAAADGETPDEPQGAE